MGPIAPKDPVKQRQNFYIMYEKEIYAGPSPDVSSKGISFHYQNDGRMINSAKMIGNIQDEEMLSLLKTTDGFKKLVYGIGVSMINKTNQNAKFVFQMYGKTDPYKSGTSIEQELTGDGVEYLIPLKDVIWSEDDDIPGQIRFHFDEVGFASTVSVRFFLNESYTAPVFEPLDPVNTASDAYFNMISKSGVSLGNTSRIKKVVARAQAGESVTVAFIGGSITQGAGATPINTECYPYKMFREFNEKYSSLHNAKFIKAGVGGTPSELGIVRFERDILANKASDKNPDLFVIEFAVNDAGDETNGECYEGLVRRCLGLENNPAVILLFSVFADDYNLQERLIPIGKHYDLPMVSLKNAVTPQFYLNKSEGKLVSKSQYFYDTYHPTNLGHTIMKDCLINIIDKSLEASEGEEFSVKDAYFTTDFDYIHSFGRDDYSRKIKEYDTIFIENIDCGDFSETDKLLQCVEMNDMLQTTPEFPDNWKHLAGNKPFVLTATFRVLMFVTMDSASPDFGIADVFVDGKLVKTINPREVGWTHCNAQIISRNSTAAKHVVEIRMHEGDEDKMFTLLGIGMN